MIRNQQELTIVRKQLARIRSALASLRRRVLPKNKRNFQVLSEGYLDTITELRTEIDAYRTASKKNGAAKTNPVKQRAKSKG